MEATGRTSSYLEWLSCNLLERRQARYKQKSQTDSFWLWGGWNISYLVAKWQSVLIVHNTATTLQRGTPGLKSKKIPVVFLLPSLAIYFSLIFLHTHTLHPCMLACFTLYKWWDKNFGQLYCTMLSFFVLNIRQFEVGEHFWFEDIGKVHFSKLTHIDFKKMTNLY